LRAAGVIPELGVKYRSLLDTTELNRLRIVLVSARNPLNIGAAARAMSNFGCFHLRLVNPYKVAFRNARSAVGAAPLLASAEEYDNVAEAVADCSLVVGTTAVRHREVQHVLRRLEPGGKLIRQRLATSEVALLFGSERFGLTNEDMSHCHWLMNIPTREGHISMNLGQAVAVCLYELVRSGSAKTKLVKKPSAGARHNERITTSLMEALQISGYLKPNKEGSTELKLRRMIRRMALQNNDAEAWMGMLRQILWKLKASDR
jgi:TrmH family RNA methyltransferase